MTEQPSITCPVCDRTSYHPKDIEYGWCAHCNSYTTGPPRWCEACGASGARHEFGSVPDETMAQLGDMTEQTRLASVLAKDDLQLLMDTIKQARGEITGLVCKECFFSTPFALVAWNLLHKPEVGQLWKTRLRCGPPHQQLRITDVSEGCVTGLDIHCEELFSYALRRWRDRYEIVRPSAWDRLLDGGPV